MSSTNIFQGITNERSSSRVLRPPGGGSTDVLGLSAQPEPVQKKSNPRNVSSIMEGTNPVPEAPPKAAEAPKPEAPKPEAPKSEAPKAAVKASQQQQNNIVPEPAVAKAPPAAVPESKPAKVSETNGQSAPNNASQRGRVPPGGFSSGLW